MKPIVAVDEMFPEGIGPFLDEDGGINSFPVDSNREGIHADFKNNFGDLFDDDDLS